MMNGTFIVILFQAFCLYPGLHPPKFLQCNYVIRLTVLHGHVFCVHDVYLYICVIFLNNNKVFAHLSPYRGIIPWIFDSVLVTL